MDWAASSQKRPSNMSKMWIHIILRMLMHKVSSLCSPFIHSTVSNDLLADSDSPDQTVQMYRVIRAFNECICPKTHFYMASPM